MNSDPEEKAPSLVRYLMSSENVNTISRGIKLNFHYHGTLFWLEPFLDNTVIEDLAPLEVCLGTSGLCSGISVINFEPLFENSEDRLREIIDSRRKSSPQKYIEKDSEE